MSIACFLDEAHTAIETGDLVDALIALGKAWASTLDHEVAELVDLVDARLAAPPIAPGTWEERARPRRIEDLGPLLAALLDAPAEDAARRLERLALGRWFADPRITAAVVRWIEARPRWPDDRESAFYNILFHALEHGLDRRGLARLRTLEGTLWRIYDGSNVDLSLHKRIREATEHVARAGRLLTRDERDRCSDVRALLTGSTRPPPTADELHAAILDAPDDDTLRVRYGEVLRDLGDPRGEMIALELGDNVDDDTADERWDLAHMLETEHRGTWVGRLAPHVVLESVMIRRGFPVVCALAPQSDEQLQHAIGLPEWATIEMILGPAPLALIRHPVMRALRGIGPVDAEVAVALANDPPARRLCVLHVDLVHAATSRTFVDAIAASPQLGALSKLRIRIRRDDGLPYALETIGSASAHPHELQLVLARRATDPIEPDATLVGELFRHAAPRSFLHLVVACGAWKFHGSRALFHVQPADITAPACEIQTVITALHTLAPTRYVTVFGITNEADRAAIRTASGAAEVTFESFDG